ncbi:interleukin-13 receptor subunit alpha-1-like [Candoia aspera]|uniref:interleukin-13 receptor subunit alpha-1-like n=1 Tax=Candoia aspera TaxID=51853 RepID=UPI002FD84191
MGVPPQPLLLAHLAGVVLAAGALLSLPSLSNVSYVFDKSSCRLSIAWDPVNFSSNSCELMYHTALNNGKEWTENHWQVNHSKKRPVPLGDNLSFGLRASCMTTNTEQLKGEWFTLSLAQNGTAGTGAANLSCICRNAQWMECSWRRGRNAPRGTNYQLSFWCNSMKEGQLCTDRRVDGDTFRCTFPIACSGQRGIAISVLSDSQDIQPVCMITKEGTGKADYPIKLDPPSNLKVTKSSNTLFLTWTPPIAWHGICYEVEKNDRPLDIYEDSTNITVPLERKKHHTLRVRAVLPQLGGHCSKIRGPWSEWSEKVHWDDRDKNQTLMIALCVIIPLCAAALTILLLVHLKRIQLLIFPIIPDPEKVLKRMFEDQREEYQSIGHPFEPIKPDITKTDLKMS